MKKISLLGLTLLSMISLAACRQQSSNSQTPIVETISSSEQPTSSSQELVVNTELRQKFDSILVGDSSNAGDGGQSLEEVKNLLGEAKATNTTEINGVTAENLTWTDGDVTISVAFVDGKVVNKAITGFLFKRDSNIGLTNFNELALGTSYADVVAVWGEPDIYTESKVLGSKSVGATWFSNIKGSDPAANAFLVFTDDSVAQKEQTDMTD
ncbi:MULTISPECIES: DUF3862 domain-containing protein [unclassified Streptococcus]|uniref:DUF3862 domain-containing protein n=1 Tax=unclassified Streptococcus TaxID=2608887 RepID=UPI0011B4F9C7|nr:MULTISPECIES: DUF3862 domain-containing protein [unclassified Streptococcus]TWS94211.1 DUF3862 domain-containing protein [Streptococcus sp. sy018]TWT14729.1 DUF3862 domain-containing protein [Streptococcus sp. sy010]